MKSDFSGYATKSNIRCSDGRTIMPDAFKDCDGMKVPMVYQHDHNDPTNVIGHAILENRKDGVYCYGFFNNNEKAIASKEAVAHGDMSALSIYANHLQQNGNNVTHGNIREVSLVLAGANPGAFIDNVTIAHTDGDIDDLEDEAIIYSGENLTHGEDPEDAFEMKHADSDEKSTGATEEKDEPTVSEVLDSLTDIQSQVVYGIIGEALNQGKAETQHNEAKHSDSEDKTDSGDKTDSEDKTDEVKHSDTSDEASKSQEISIDKNKDAVEHSEEKGDQMSQVNIFEKNKESDATKDAEGVTLSHDDQTAFMKAAESDPSGSFKKYALQHAQDYGITDVTTLFPDAKSVRTEPDLYKRDNEWVSDVLGSTNHTPFSRIKSQYADLTEDAARAKGYTLDRNNNKRKLDEIIKVYKRTTTPTTVYVKQKLDRDDTLDITDFDVVNWLMRIMRVLLDEEIARAILIGDGRLVSSDDHINTESIRPIVSDDDLYVIYNDGFSDETNSALVDRIRTSKVGYQGSGQPTAYVSPSLHARLAVSRDQMGRRLYDSDTSLAFELGVSKIVEVPVLEGFKDESGKSVLSIIVNPKDYSTGTDRGGDVTSFNDFDIDYNQHKYLLETRLSGALTLPKSAIVITESPKA